MLDSALGVYSFYDGAGNDVPFLRTELLDPQGKPTNTFRADEPIKCRIIYQMLRELSGASVALTIRDALGGSLWGMRDLDFFPKLYEERKPGTYVYDCNAPADILRPGTYQLGLGVGSGSQYFHHPADPPLFEVSSNGYWRGTTAILEFQGADCPTDGRQAAILVERE